MNSEKALKKLHQAMTEDPDYAWTWHCTIAMSMQDEGIEHASSNFAAARVMRAAFDVDTESLIPKFLPGCRRSIRETEHDQN